MKTYQTVGIIVVGVALGVSALFCGLSSYNNYHLSNENLVSNSRATGFYDFTGKMEYTQLGDGSEEIQLRTENGSKVVLYQNLNGDDTVDRIRIERYQTRDIFRLEEILIRALNYPKHESEFNQADEILLEERQRYSP
ncbi:MAG: hypothetical protein Q8Q01_00115 [archaeon]|nr:hypothetical protein [archaeon]